MTVHASWRAAAACRDADPELFFPVGTAGPALRQTEEAKRICGACPAQAPCLAWALDHAAESGVWGGATEDERRALRRPAGRSRSAELIWIRATAARIRVACEKVTAPTLGMLRDSVECAASLPTKPGWERKAAAHAEIFRLLAEIAGDRAAGNPGDGAGFAGELMHAVGPAANGMITSSRRRLLGHLAAGDAGAAEREMETHLRALFYMWRLTWASRSPATSDSRPSTATPVPGQGASQGCQPLADAATAPPSAPWSQSPAADSRREQAAAVRRQRSAARQTEEKQ